MDELETEGTDGNQARNPQSFREKEIAREKESEVRKVQDKFDAVMKLKADEIDKLKDQLDSIKEEHEKR
jgi:hypothetical protein